MGIIYKGNTSLVDEHYFQSFPCQGKHLPAPIPFAQNLLIDVVLYILLTHQNGLNQNNIQYMDGY